MKDEDRETLKVDMGSEGTKIVKTSFPSNSRKDKEKTESKAEEPKKLEKVITGSVIQKKKSLGRKFMETFVGDDIKNIKSYVLFDVVIPAAKDTISDIAQSITETIQGSIEVALFGETRRRGSSRNKFGKTYVSYDRMSSRDRDRKDDRRDDRRDIARSKTRHDFRDVILETRGEAEEVLSCLVDLIDEYGEATVASLYDLVEITGEFTDNKWGWTNLSSASVSRVREGYMLNLPRPIFLD